MWLVSSALRLPISPRIAAASALTMPSEMCWEWWVMYEIDRTRARVLGRVDMPVRLVPAARRASV